MDSSRQSAMDRTESAPDAKLGEEPAVVEFDEVAVGGKEKTATSTPTTSKSVEELAEEQRTWHEQRIRKRLQNEYERAGRALSAVVGDNLDAPMRLNSIRVIGANHTRAGFLARVASPYLSTSAPPSTSFTSSLLSLIYPTQQASTSSIDDAEHFQTTETLRQVLAKTRNLSDDLTKLGIFESVEAGLDKSRDVLADPYDVDLVLKVKEASRYFLRTATDVGDGEGNATATARVRNAFGGAETLEGNMSFGTRTKSNFAIRLATPLFAQPDTTLSLSTFATERDLSYYAACRESLRGVKVGLRTLSALGDHEFAYDAILRNMCDVGTGASMSIRNAAGLSVKSAISHTLLRDTRDDPFIASRGSYFRLMQEYAGLGGDASFFKTETETQFSRPIGAGCTLSWSLRGGLLYPLGGKPSHFLDRIHLGGPTSVRMFKMNGLGPRDHNDFVGGDLQWSSGLSLITPIPKCDDWPIKGHFFLNAGRLVAFNQNLTQSFSDLLREPAVTAGFGVMYRHSIVRAELNFGMPLAAHKGDGVRKGLQMGLGLHFL